MQIVKRSWKKLSACLFSRLLSKIDWPIITDDREFLFPRSPAFKNGLANQNLVVCSVFKNGLAVPLVNGHKTNATKWLPFIFITIKSDGITCILFIGT